MDMILTGRPVDAKEAYEIGLANRVVPKGHALDAAIELASEIAKFPQRCLRSDRLSSVRQWSLGLDEALQLETRLGRAVIDSGETQLGAGRFSGGAGRHGRFD